MLTGLSKNILSAEFHPTTLVDLLRFRALYQPDKRAYTFLLDGETSETHLTYQELDQKARAIGVWLQSMDAEGERVLLLYPSGLEYITAFFGCLYAGAIAVPAYPPHGKRKLPQLRTIVSDAQAKFALTTQSIHATAERLFAPAPELKFLRWLVTEDLIDDMGDDWHKPLIKEDTVAFLQYTSGSTGAPKGVMLNHANLLYNQRMIKKAFRHTTDTIVVGWLPLYHDMGLIGNVFQPLYVGIPCILMSPNHFMQQPLRWLSAISRYKATTSGAPNFAYDLCVQKSSPEQRATLDLNHWRVAFNGAEPVRSETLDRFAKAFSSYGFHREAFYPCYGLAEATLLVAGGEQKDPPVIRSIEGTAFEQNRIIEVKPSDESARLLVSCGKTVLNQELLIVQPETTIPCLNGEVGEIWIKGQNIAQGYWRQPEETAHTFGAWLSDTGTGPYLRTGDLGFLQDNELFVTGRLKDLIIIRGRNHYPQDIELTVEESHQALRSGGCVAFSTEADSEEQLMIVAEVERHHLKNLDVEVVGAAIQQAIAEEHEVQVYVTILIKPGNLPLTSSGKKKRHVCRHQFREGNRAIVGKWEAPLTTENEVFEKTPFRSNWTVESVQTWLISQLAAQVDVQSSQIDVNKPIIQYGLDSLKAVEFVSSIEEHLEVTLPMVTFLEGANIAQIATHVLAESPECLDSTIKPISQSASPSLSFSQAKMWFFNQLVPHGSLYNIPTALRLEGRLHVAALTQSLDEIIRRHEVLRTTFPSAEGQPVQVVSKNWAGAPCSVDLQDLSPTERGELATHLATLVAQRPFDLQQGPLVKSIWFQLDKQEALLLVLTHHIVFDGSSIGILIQELTVLYETFSAGNPTTFEKLPIQYGDFAHWQRQWLQGQVLETQLSYWKQQLAGVPPVRQLPTDFARPHVQTFQGARENLVLSLPLSNALQALSRQEGVTLFMALLTAFQILLYRYTEQDDSTIGCHIANRNRNETKGLIGFFANMLVFRMDMSGNPSFQEMLSRTRKICLDAYARQDVPFEKLVEEVRPLRGLSHMPLCQVVFNMPNLPRETLEVSQLTFSPVDIDTETSRFDLALAIVDTANSLRGWLQYNTDLFQATTIRRLLRNFEVLLSNIVKDSSVPIGELEILSDAERQQLLIEFNDTKTDDPIVLCIRHPFEKHVVRTPDRIAIVDKEELTYNYLRESLGPFLHGGEVWLLPPDLMSQTDPQVGLNPWEVVLNLICEENMIGPPKSRICIMIDNESVSRQLVDKSFTTFPSLLMMWYQYGSTETTPHTCIARIVSGDEVIHQGLIVTTQSYILDQHLMSVPVGVPGELYISGVGLSQGYLGRPDLTAEKFIPNPFTNDKGARIYKSGELVRYQHDGSIELLGRINYQAKIRGCHINLSKVEAILNQHPTVREAIVTTQEDISGEDFLVGYVVPVQEQSPTTGDLRRFLSGMLPEYMTPSVYVVLPALPLTPNGTIDYQVLPTPEQISPELEKASLPPRTPVEETLASIWRDLLAVNRVGINDDFFALGGHSLLATQVVSRVHDTLGVKLPLRCFFETPTVADLAIEITREQAKQVEHETFAQMLAEIENLSEEETQAALAIENRLTEKGDPQ